MNDEKKKKGKAVEFASTVAQDVTVMPPVLSVQAYFVDEPPREY